MSKPKRFIITFQDQTIYEAVKYFDSKQEAQAWAASVYYWEPSSGCQSIDSELMKMEVREDERNDDRTQR
jgi:hypothetical protein